MRGVEGCWETVEGMKRLCGYNGEKEVRRERR